MKDVDPLRRAKMVAERKYIDLEDDPNWAEIARAVHDSAETVFIRERGRTLAVLRPLTESESTYIDDPVERLKAFREAAGSWKGIVDDDLIRAVLHRSGRIRAPLSVEVLSNEEREERRERILALAGSLKGHIPDNFVEENYRQRLTPSWRETEQS
jgi:hypothetical protein